MAKIYYCERIQSKVREKEKPQGSGGRRCELPRSCHCLLQTASAARPGCSAPCNSRAMRIKHLSLTGALCCHPLPQWQSWNWVNIPPGTTSAFLKNLEDVWVCTLAKRDDDSDGNGALCWSASRNDRQRKQARVSCEALWGKCPLRGKQQMKGELNCSHHRLPFSFTQPPSCPNNHLTFSGYVSVPAEKGPHLTPLRAHRLEKTESHRRKHTLEAQRCRDSVQETAANCSRPWAPQSAQGAAEGALPARASAAPAVTREGPRCPAHKLAVKTDTGTKRAAGTCDEGPPGFSATLVLSSSQSRAQLGHEGRTQSAVDRTRCSLTTRRGQSSPLKSQQHPRHGPRPSPCRRETVSGREGGTQRAPEDPGLETCSARPSALPAAAPGMHMAPWEQVRTLAAPPRRVSRKGMRFHSLF